MELQQYISAIQAKLTASSIISSVEIVDERALLNRGYFRARLTLCNNDFLEIAESFTIQNERYITLDYRYQWMDETKQQLRKRWDSVRHFPELSNFPHHVHITEESNVESSQSRSILEFIDFMEQELI